MANNKLFSEVFMTWSGATIGYATDFSFNFKGDTMETTSAQSSGMWKEFLPGLTEWDCDCSGMWVRSGGTYKTPDDMLSNFVTGNTLVSLSFTSSVTGDKIWTGNAIVTSVGVSVKIGDKETYKLSFKGTGAITITTK